MAPRDGSTDDPARYGRTRSFLLRQPIAASETHAVRDLVAGRRSGDEADASWLVPGDDVVTVSLFLDRHDGTGDALVWYVELADGDAWTDPAATLAGRSPLYDDGLERHLSGETALYGDAERVVHVHNPARPARPDPADVVLVRLDVEPGLGTWLARLLAGLVDALAGTWVERRLVAASGDVIEDEEMWTETLFLEASDGEYAVLWYMEAADMDRVVEVYETTDNRVARYSAVVLDRLFESPMATLGDPMAASDYELLGHGTNAARR